MIARTSVRKLLHLSVAAIPLCWGLGLVGAATVRSALTLALVVAVAAEVLRARSRRVAARFNALVGALLKPHERTAMTGATWLAAAMLLAVVVLPAPAARAALWAGAAGDAAAALAGTAFAAGAASRGKTLIGSLACGLTTALGAWWLGPTPWAAAAVLGVVAAAAEWPARPGDDNLRVTLAVGLAAWLLGGG